jgi:hypothetical protein
MTQQHSFNFGGNRNLDIRKMAFAEFQYRRDIKIGPPKLPEKDKKKPTISPETICTDLPSSDLYLIKKSVSIALILPLLFCFWRCGFKTNNTYFLVIYIILTISGS